MAVATYDPSGLTLSVFGSVPHGLADGTFLTIERDEELFTTVQGADAEVARAKIPGSLGTIRLGLLQTSTFNAVLSAAVVADGASGAGIGPFVLREGNTVIASGECWVRAVPSVEYGKEINAREWTLTVAKFAVFVVGGNSPS